MGEDLSLLLQVSGGCQEYVMPRPGSMSNKKPAGAARCAPRINDRELQVRQHTCVTVYRRTHIGWGEWDRCGQDGGRWQGKCLVQEGFNSMMYDRTQTQAAKQDVV